MTAAADKHPAVQVIARGVATSVRDGGRRGLAHLGRSRGGAVDPEALHTANRLVGNPPDAPGIETSGGLVIRPERAVLVAVTGSQADMTVELGPPLGWGVPTALPAGCTLRVGRLRGGARLYLAVRGAVVDRRDTFGLGAVEPVDDPSLGTAVPRRLDRVARVWPGPRLDWFDDAAWTVLTSTQWTVGADSDRAGARLDGGAIGRRIAAELPSEALVEGAIQIPPDGRPIVMLADHPVTGGYPVIAVVDRGDLEVIAQASPGVAIRFRSAR
jgi:allophanate hydrolase subunit 2